MVLLVSSICLQQREIVRSCASVEGVDMAAQVDSCTFTVEFVRAFASIISALAWPAVVFGAVLFFRKEIEKLLKRLAHIRARYGDLEVWLDKAKKTAEKLQKTP